MPLMLVQAAVLEAHAGGRSGQGAHRLRDQHLARRRGIADARARLAASEFSPNPVR
jgi:hypothetical protein